MESKGRRVNMIALETVTPTQLAQVSTGIISINKNDTSHHFYVINIITRAGHHGSHL